MCGGELHRLSRGGHSRHTEYQIQGTLMQDSAWMFSDFQEGSPVGVEGGREWLQVVGELSQTISCIMYTLRDTMRSSLESK